MHLVSYNHYSCKLHLSGLPVGCEIWFPDARTFFSMLHGESSILKGMCEFTRNTRKDGARKILIANGQLKTLWRYDGNSILNYFFKTLLVQFDKINIES